MTLAAHRRLPLRSLPMTVIVLLLYIGVAAAMFWNLAETPWAIVHGFAAASGVVALIEAIRAAGTRGLLERELYGPGEPDRAALDYDDEEEW